MEHTDLNSIIDEVAPNSTGLILNEIDLLYQLGVALNVKSTK